MTVYLFILAVVFLVFGHFFKMLRWKQFIEIYEEPQEKMLLKALTMGYIGNLCLPFRIGDFIRIGYAGKRMKNGFSFSLATTIVDKYLDIIVVGGIFLTCCITGLNNKELFESAIFYSIISIISIIGSVFAIKYSMYPKRLVRKIAKIFNTDIEAKILFVLWGIISSFKDTYIRVDRKKLLFNTLCMWSFYLLSYFCIANFIIMCGTKLSVTNIFLFFFSKDNVLNSLGQVSQSNLFEKVPVIMWGYTLCPIILLLVLVLIMGNQENNGDIVGSRNELKKYLMVLPQINENERLKFLEAYFTGENRTYFKNYLEINRDISIISDLSAGSNATTILCADSTGTFFRKYAFGDDGDKLKEQIRWLDTHKNSIQLPEILKEKYNGDYCYYDMAFNDNAVVLFEFVHTIPTAEGWNIISLALKELERNLYSVNRQKVDSKIISQYIESKIIKNIKAIENSEVLRNLVGYKDLVINGKSYHNLDWIKQYLNKEFLFNIFCNDEGSDIHGDLTMENIVVIRGGGYYFIDPNTGNILDSSNLDYAKLLQSLHGGYEFLMKTPNVTVEDNCINYLYTKSYVYDDLFLRFDKFMSEEFSYERIRSIYFHEIVHWLRLMPYKIAKNGKRSIIFYSRLIIIANEIIERFREI